MKLEKINSIKSETPSFGGYKDAYKADGQQAYKFYAPNFDKNKYSLTLEVAPVKSMQDGYMVDTHSIVDLKASALFENNAPVLLPKGKGSLLDDPQFGYRFKLVSKENNSVQYLNDPGLKTEGNDAFNIVFNKVGGVSKQGPMYHIFPDSYNLKSEKLDDMVRTHFNVAGGNIQGIIEKLKETDELKPYKLIISTPLFGADEVTSHGYWTSNPFQISSLKGNLQDFKDLNAELFKQGKQFVADGAFTSQSFESPFLQHAIKWGADSPYYNWFKFDYTGDEKGSKIALGILPDCNNAFDRKTSDKKETKGGLSNIHYRVVNNPYEPGYNKTNPTYLQFYDSRLVESELLNPKKLIRKYDNKNTQDPYDIYSHQDSVQPFAFEIRRSGENDSKLQMLANKNLKNKPLSQIDNYERLLEFDNFVITRKSHNGGANYWDGQLDLVKLNLSNPTARNALASTHARNSLYNAATYWTKTVNDALVISLAKDPGSIESVAKANGIANYAEIKNKVASGEYKTGLFKENLSADKFILNELAEFPLESIEVSPNLSAIFGSPYFTPSATDPAQINANRGELALNGQSAQIYKNITALTKAVLVKMNSEKKPIFQGENNLTEYGKFITRFIAPDMVKFAVVRSLFPGLVNLSENDLTYEARLREMSVQDVVTDAVKCDKEAGIIKNKLQEQLPELISDVDTIASVYKNRLGVFNLKDLKLAQAVVEQSGAGLNWRFDAAKDVADLDTVRAGANPRNKDRDAFEDKNPMDNALKEMTNFWKPFVANIKKQNPNALSIAEMTCLGEMYGLIGQETYPKAQVAEKAFYLETGATTGSSYSYLFSTIPKLFGQSIEHGSSKDAQVNWLVEDIKGLLSSGSLPFVQNSHIFVDNHDKPRALHAFSVDTRFFLSEFRGMVTQPNADQLIPNEQKKVEEIAYTKKLLGDDVDINNISSKGVAVADAYIKAIYSLDDFNEEQKTALKKAAIELAQGKTKGGSIPNKGRSEAFGYRPFEVTVKDLFDRSDLGLDPATKAKLENKITATMTKSGREKLVKMWEVLNAIEGVPTIFSGTEFSQTGYETPNKNKELGCRGIILHKRATAGDEYAKTYKDIQAISSLAQQEGMSALHGGTSILLNNGLDSAPMLPIYKYDDKGSEVITVLTDLQVNAHRNEPQYFNPEAKNTFSEIKLESSDRSVSLAKYLNQGTKFSRKILKNGQYVDDGFNYIINKDGNLVREGEKEIVLNGGANFFYRKDSDYAPSFKGSSKVDLHNKKYLIH